MIGQELSDHLTDLSEKLHFVPESHFRYLEQLKASGFEPEVIYDIGSCVLHWTNAAKTLWPNAKFYLFDAFEPAEFLYIRDGYQYHLGVLSDRDGATVKFYQNDLQPGGNSYYREIGCPISHELFPEKDGYVLKTTRTLDSVVSERGFPKPDFIKMDVQGCEKDILAGAKETLASVEHLIVEMQHTDYNEGAPKVDETLPFIESLGFLCVAPRFSDNVADADYGFVRNVGRKMKIVYYISFPGKPMADVRSVGLSGSHTAAVATMEHLALTHPEHEFVVCRSSVQRTSERAINLRYVDSIPADADVLILTTLDCYPRIPFPRLKHVVYVTHSTWNPHGVDDPLYVLQDPRIKMSIVYLCEWTKRHVLHNLSNPYVRQALLSPRVSSHVVGNALLDDTLPDLLLKVPRSFAYVAVWERGGEVALRAFRKIRDAIPEASFHVASYDDGNALAERLAGEPNVFYHSSLGKKELTELLAKTETLLYPLVLPSRILHKDTFACVVCEALACGMRVITFRQGALEELYGEWVDFIEAPEPVQRLIANLDHVTLIPWCASEDAVDKIVEMATKAIFECNDEKRKDVAKTVRDRFSQTRLGQAFDDLLFG